MAEGVANVVRLISVVVDSYSLCWSLTTASLHEEGKNNIVMQEILANRREVENESVHVYISN